MRNKFQEQLDILNEHLLEMCSLVETSMALTKDGLLNKNVEKSKKVIGFDKKIDRKEKEIEDICLDIFLKQQPVASDLRVVSAALKVITDLERIGDQSANISEIAIFLAEKEEIKVYAQLVEMIETTINMIKLSIDSYVQKNVEEARRVIEMDDIVDDLFDVIKKILIDIATEGHKDIDQIVDLLMVAKYLERIADNSCNIAEWAIFALTGEHKDDKLM